MNREILFRGKRADNNEWVYGSLLQEDKRTYIGNYVNKILYGNKVIFAGGRSNKRETTKWQPFGLMEVIPETISQYTGLTDKNDKKIFEGDIIQDGHVYGTVVYSQEYGGFGIEDIEDGFQVYAEYFKDSEVIGNIYDKEVEE